jgi:hypothetical protein
MRPVTSSKRLSAVPSIEGNWISVDFKGMEFESEVHAQLPHVPSALRIPKLHSASELCTRFEPVLCTVEPEVCVAEKVGRRAGNVSGELSVLVSIAQRLFKRGGIEPVTKEKIFVRVSIKWSAPALSRTTCAQGVPVSDMISIPLGSRQYET